VHYSHKKSPTAFPVHHRGEADPWADGTLGPVVLMSDQLTGPNWDGDTVPGPVTNMNVIYGA